MPLFIGLALWLLGVPLLVPFIVLVFLAAFVPIIGILVVGALAILVALATKGWVAAVILLGVFLRGEPDRGPPAAAAGRWGGRPAASAGDHPGAGGGRRSSPAYPARSSPCRSPP